MSRRRPKKRRTDYGTIILHWLLVGSLVVAVVTGLRIAAEAPDRTWINSIDGLLPTSTVWTGHIPAAVALTAIAVAYATYVPLAGLARRIRLDRVRLRGLFASKQQRWGAINVILYWGFYATLLVQLATGGLLYFGYANAFLLEVHWYGMWVIFGYAGLHVMSHWTLGGSQQLLRIVRPALLSPPTPPFDPAEIFALLDQPAKASKPAPAPRPAPTRRPAPVLAREAGGERPPKWRDATPERDQAPRRQPGRQAEAPAGDHMAARPKAPRTSDAPPPRNWPEAEPRRPQRRRGPVLQANPFIVATAVALVGVTVLLTVDRQMVDTIKVRRIARSEAPVLDGDASDAAWRRARPFYILTEQGGNFDGKGETTVEIRGVHDGERAYFLFVWDDPTRSLKQLPLQKAADGWHLLHDGYEIGDEHAYSEDKFSVLLTKLDLVLAGDRTFHAGPEPIAGKPATLSGRGLHYTTQDNLYVDVWEWRATSGGAFGYMDDLHFGPPAKATQAQLDGKTPYRGGFEPDPGSANFSDNFDPQRAGGYRHPIMPRRLPKDYKAMTAAMGQIDLDPHHGESDGARWYMTEAESVAYSPEVDAQIPVGTVIPGVIIAGEYSGDRADVRCAARWAAGRWVLETTRLLDSKSKYDTAISTGTFMRVVAFDHSQIRHTRHTRPIRLEVE
jgi:Ethylbenzene dehydrogenase/Prokaryotic cytochrome b561